MDSKMVTEECIKPKQILWNMTFKKKKRKENVARSSLNMNG